jgi:colanic acid/amylovoran biosynthesis protein
MNIEILGAGFKNKGAHLMLIAIVEALSRSYPEARLAVRSKKGKNWDPGGLGLYQKPAISEHVFGNLVTRLRFNRQARQQYKMILDSDVDVILDASGFKYSDQFDHFRIWRRAKKIANWKKSGKKIILLPQAFGPFEVPKVRAAVKLIVENCDLLFPRDPDSLGYVNRLVGDQEHIQMYPDFTNKIGGIVPEYFPAAKSRACLVPNAQMIKKTSDAVGESYIPFFAKCARYLEKSGLEPFILPYDLKKDRSLAHEITEKSGVPMEIIEEENPLHLKGIIGKCHLVVGSRFHALICALSQGIPALATGWSHKYNHLYNDYRCTELLISDLDFEAQAQEKLQRLKDPVYRESIIQTLKESSQVQIRKNGQMWNDVFEVISG